MKTPRSGKVADSDLEAPFEARERSIISPLSGRAFRETTFERGMVRLSTLSALSNAEEAAGLPDKKARHRLQVQSMLELTVDQGYSSAVAVLDRADLWAFPRKRWDELAAQIRSKVPKSHWLEIEARLRPVPVAERMPDIVADRYLVAVWADLFAPPLGNLWLAANAMFLYEEEGNEFAFGYLTALLNGREASEKDVLRGRRSVDSARQGGQVRAASHAARTRKVLDELGRLIGEGHSVKRASELAAANHVGSSAEANRKLWSRHSRG